MNPHVRCALFSLGLIVAAAAAARAQTADARKWEIEFHGGGLWPSNPSGGAVGLPGPGQVFTTATANPNPAPSSRRQSSWYFGDGATLFNQAAAALFAQSASATGLAAQITALDPVLGRSLGEPTRGGSIGMTISRVLTPRLSAELGVDYGLSRLRLTRSNIDALEATRASFVPAFTGVIRFNPNRVLNGVTSTAALADGNAHQLTASGAVIVNLRTTGRAVPYASAGVGLISIVGDSP